MKIQHINSHFPFIIIDDFYSENELDLIWEELFFLCHIPLKLRPSSIDQGAAVENGKILKTTHSVYLDGVYTQREYSNILNVNRKLFVEFDNIFETSDSWFYRNLTFNQDFTQVSYYENGDEYEAHQDNSMITCLSWFYQEPRRFTGGDLLFPDYDISINIANNRMVIFPSHIFHKVEKVKMDKQYENQKKGRFCISQFLQKVTDFQSSRNLV